VAAVLLEVAPDVAQQRDVADAGDDEQHERDAGDDDGEGHRARERVRDEGAVGKVLGRVVPVARDSRLGEPERVERDGVDGLAGRVRKHEALPALEGEEDEEGVVVLALGGVADVVEEAEVVVRAQRVVVVRHHVRERVRDVAALDDLLRLACLVREQEEAEDDTAEEDPAADVEVDGDAAFRERAAFEDVVGPVVRGDHRDGREHV
jgi:hypothetical protein